MRGFGRADRRRQLKNHIAQEKLDIVGIQETIKQDFFDNELHDIAGDRPFQWSWLPAKGKSGGGILMGVKVGLLEIENVAIMDFCIIMNIRNRLSNIRFLIAMVYGPTQNDLFVDFLQS